MRCIASLMLGLFMLNAYAMSNTAEAVTAGTAQGLVNAGIAIYMQRQGMNPQFVNSPTGPYVVPGNSGANSQNNSHNGVSPYQQQNNQSQKQAFFNGN